MRTRRTIPTCAAAVLLMAGLDTSAVARLDAQASAATQTPAPASVPAPTPGQTPVPGQVPEPAPPAAGTYQPQVGQAGKDVVWVPTSPALVEKMLDMAKVTAADFVMDLGSGDGRNIIAAAKRGARGVGVEFNPEMVAFSRRQAEHAGVADKASFVEADMYEADVNKASVLALFLLSDNLRRLSPKFLDMRPGSRIVVNTFTIPDWEPDEKETIEGDCTSWCTSLLWIVPAKVEGRWRLPAGELELQQKFQVLSGTLSAGDQKHPIENGRLRGEEITFTAGGTQYTGRVNGNAMEGRAVASGTQTSWKASRAAAPPAPAVPAPDAGEVIKAEFAASTVYPGTWREYWVYIPRGLDRTKPAPVMVFQDGLQYNAPAVFDDLIRKKAIPPLVGLFVMHGRVRALAPDALDRMNRSFEYDAVSGDYARFLLDELLPHVAKTHNLTLSADPNDRAIAGNSSGAIAAFVAAWQRPDAFRRVFSAIGTYVGLRGGNEFPVLIRKTEPKPIRIFLQDGRNDLNNYTGSWWVANQDMQSAFEYAGYDVRHVWGDGEHNSRQATELFPDAVTWLWRDWPAPITANPEGKSRQDVFQVLQPGEDWQLVSEGHRPTDGPAANDRGEMFFSDRGNHRIHRVGLDGKVTLFAEQTNGGNGMMFGPDGRLYVGASRTRQIVAYDTSGRAEVLAEDVTTNDLAVNVKGDLYFTDSPGKKVWLLQKGAKPRVVDEGIEGPNGVLFSPDQSLLYVSDHAGQLSWVFQVQRDGSLAHKQRYFYVHLPDAATRSGADGMAVDADGRVYIATTLGVQVFDQIGKCHAIIPAPQSGTPSNVEFGGANFDELYITAGDKVFKRKTKVKGVLSWRPPIKPAPPRL